jgi:hypothetical protein
MNLIDEAINTVRDSHANNLYRIKAGRTLADEVELLRGIASAARALHGRRPGTGATSLLVFDAAMDDLGEG